MVSSGRWKKLTMLLITQRARSTLGRISESAPRNSGSSASDRMKSAASIKMTERGRVRSIPRICPSRTMSASSRTGPRSRSKMNLFFSSCGLGSRSTTASWVMVSSTITLASRGAITSSAADGPTATSASCPPSFTGTRTASHGTSSPRAGGAWLAPLAANAITLPRPSSTQIGAQSRSDARRATAPATCSNRSITAAASRPQDDQPAVRAAVALAAWGDTLHGEKLIYRAQHCRLCHAGPAGEPDRAGVEPARPTGNGVSDYAVPLAVLGRPALGAGGGDHNDTRHTQRRRDVRDASVVAHHQARVAHQRRECAKTGSADQIDRSDAHRLGDRRGEWPLGCRAGEHHGIAALGQSIGDGGEPLREPAPSGGPGARVQTDVPARDQPARRLDRLEVRHVL